MTISRLLILQALILCGLAGGRYVPRNEHLQPSRVNMDLPEALADWKGKPSEVTQNERDILAKDTQFSRKVYTDSFGDSVFVSIVLSGQDLDNSIHRPERCLPAQGWTLLDSKGLSIPVPSAPGGALPLTRLHNLRQVKTPDGHIVPIYNLNYYWFVGNTDITASHNRREFIDIRDRVLHGYNQRWAYITVSSTITGGLVQFGKSEEETDQMLLQLIKDLYPVLVKDTPPLPAKQG